MNKIAAFILSLAAGIIIVINGITLIVLAPEISEAFLVELGTDITDIIIGLGIWGSINGAILIAGAWMINKGKMRNGGIIVLILSIIAFLTVSGFYIGSILGIVGGVFGIIAKK